MEQGEDQNAKRAAGNLIIMSRPSYSTKLDLVNSALSKIAISGITAPAMGADFQLALDRLEGMMYEFEEARNICCQYNFTINPDGADRHGMTFGLFEPISNILALRIIQDYEIPPGNALLAAASAAISSLSNQTYQVRETQYPRRQGRGAGNTLRYNRWQRFYRKPDQVPLVCSSFKLDMGEIDDYTQSWIDYLKPDEDIDAFEILITSGLELISSSNTHQTVSYRLRGLNPSIDNGVEQVRIKITTSDGRIDERLINAEVLPITSEPERFTSSE